MTVEASDVGVDPALAFNDVTTQSTLTYGEESSDARWGVTDANTGYICSPADGYALSLADGTLTLDMGEGGRYAFAKE